MTAQSPRPTLQSAFTVLLAFLLVGGLVAPIAASSPASAQTEVGDVTISEDCGAAAKFAFPRSCHVAEMAFGDIDTSQDSAAIKADAHVSAQSVGESWDAQDAVYQNYIQDTETLASLEARNAIAEAYQNNQSSAAASTAATEAIDDYYSVHQRNLVEVQSAHTERLDYLVSVSEQQSGIDDRFIAPYSTATNTYPGVSVNTVDWNGTTQGSYTLINGSSHDVNYPRVSIDGDSNDMCCYHEDWTEPARLSDYNATSETIDIPYSGESDEMQSGGAVAKWTPGVTVMNVPETGLESQTVYDYRLIGERLHQLEQQAQTVNSNYDVTVAEDLYAAMDSGDLDPNEVRGAEGMVRYMSGSDDESNVSEDRFNLALRSTLNLASGDLNETMKVHFEGATERERIASDDGSVSYEYNSVNETYEGLLFSSETPQNGFEKGQTYDVSNLDGTTTMVTDGGANETTFYQGSLTITNLYDSDGNEVESVDWSDPTYDQYNSSAYIEMLEEASEQREQIVSEDDGGGGDGGGCVVLCGEGGSNTTIGIVVVGAVVGLAIVGKLTN